MYAQLIRICATHTLLLKMNLTIASTLLLLIFAIRLPAQVNDAFLISNKTNNLLQKES